MIDTHCHIDDPQYADGLDAFIAEQKAGGVEKILVPGVNEASIEPVREVCNRFRGYLYPAIGLHPEEVKEDYKEVLDRMEDELYSKAGADYIAIGEIGLDYHFDTTFKQQQQAALRRQISWAIDKDLPLMIHSRDATEDCLNILSKTSGIRGVMHCFSGSREIAERIVKMGLYLGIGGVITFKNCKLAEHLGSISLERIVLETDAPYMAPVPNRGKRNESRWMSYVVQKLADVYGCSEEEIDRQTTENAKRLFNI